MKLARGFPPESGAFNRYVPAGPDTVTRLPPEADFGPLIDVETRPEPDAVSVIVTSSAHVKLELHDFEPPLGFLVGAGSGFGVAFFVGFGDAFRVGFGDGFDDGFFVGFADAGLVGVTEGVGEGVTPGEAGGVGDTDGVGDKLGVGVGVTITVTVAAGVGVSTGGPATATCSDGHAHTPPTATAATAAQARATGWDPYQRTVAHRVLTSGDLTPRRDTTHLPGTRTHP